MDKQLAEMYARVHRNVYRPHRLMKDLAGQLWETISWPFAQATAAGYWDVVVNIRVPGDPTTLQAQSVFDLSPEGRDCLCSQAGEFYMRVGERRFPGAR